MITVYEWLVGAMVVSCCASLTWFTVAAAALGVRWLRRRLRDQDFRAAADDALAFSARHVPGPPHPGRRLTWREQRTLRDIARGMDLDAWMPERSYEEDRP